MVFDIVPVTSTRSTNCGPCCMKMLLAYYGEEVTLEQLQQECPVTIAGWTGKNLLDVGKAHGLDMMAFKMDADELIMQDRPAIVWWLYKHFLIFSGVDENGQIVICNPSKGRYRVSVGMFKSFYSGVSFWNGDPQPAPETEPNEQQNE